MICNDIIVESNTTTTETGEKLYQDVFTATRIKRKKCNNLPKFEVQTEQDTTTLF